jgi:hypothetical protein
VLVGIRQQREETRALDRDGELALVVARVPVRRAGVILPFSPMKSRSTSISL